MKTCLLITDAWTPQTNGVVTTLTTVLKHLASSGYNVEVIHPGRFKTIPLPSYPEIRIARNPWLLKSMIQDLRPDHIHIATEGPLGLYARQLLTHRHLPFTTSLHTKFPEYLHKRMRLPVSVGYRFLRWFHRPATRTLVTTPTHKHELRQRGLTNLVVWGRGVDTAKFQPQPLPQRDRPRLLYVGRVSVEKNIEAFAKLDIDAEKVVVGDGPQRKELEQRYPDLRWLGYRKGQALVDEYANADVFVFPSRTDTFGLVMLEANACGTPVAAFPVTGPVDVVREGVNGSLNEDLDAAVRSALETPRSYCREYALANTWAAVTERFVDSMVQIDWPEEFGSSVICGKTVTS